MSNQQQYSMNMSGETAEENDVVTMDDLQFGASLDVLLASEGGTSFVDTAPPNTTQSSNNPPPSGPSMVSAGGSNTTAMRISDTTTSTGTSSLTTPVAAAAVRPVFATMPEGATTHAQQHATNSATSADLTGIHRGAAPNASTEAIRPSPLIARLNFPMSAVGQPSHPYQGFTAQQGQLTLAPAAGGRKGGRQSRATTPPMTSATRRKRGRDVGSLAVSEDESERQKRRIDRNMREQQRSHRITEQISHLREVLASSNVHFKPDKYSTLVSVVDYIKQLQSRSSLLDSEHKKLLDTIQRTNEMINNPHFPQGSNPGRMGGGPDDLAGDLEDEFGVFVRGLDYKSVFAHCGIALAVTSIDGKFMDCNPEFEELTGYSRAQLLPAEDSRSKPSLRTENSLVHPDRASSSSSDAQVSGSNEDDEEETTSSPPPSRNLSLFNLLAREHMEQVFLAMSQMLKQPVPLSPSSPVAQAKNDYWTGVVSECRKRGSQLRMNVSLVRSPRGNPKFFNCSLSPAPDMKPAARPIQVQAG